MSDALLRTKLLPPRPRARSVARPRLDDLLARGAHARLTLVSAPAGFGKTTLLANWLSAGPAGRATAWVSLDERDRDATVFWSYLLRAVDGAAPGAAPRGGSPAPSATGPPRYSGATPGAPPPARPQGRRRPPWRSSSPGTGSPTLC